MNIDNTYDPTNISKNYLSGQEFTNQVSIEQGFNVELFEVSSVAPNPPKITLKNDRFIPLHIIYDNIAPEDPTSAPVIISAVFSKVKPIPAAAQPE